MLTMLFPIGDDNSDRHITPYVTFFLIAANIAVFLLFQLTSPNNAFTYGYSVVPAEILSGHDITAAGYLPGLNRLIPQAPGPSPIYLTLLTSMFMHGGWAHLGGNMLYLWIFGDNVEDAMGHFKFLVFYLLCGLVAAAAQIFAARAAGGVNLYIPSLGASGAIAGVLGAYIVLYPRKSVYVLFGWFGIIAVPAILVIGLWIALQVFSGVGEIARVTQQTEGGGVAYWAHIGGAIAGVILVFLFRNAQVQQRADMRSHPYQSGLLRFLRKTTHGAGYFWVTFYRSLLNGRVRGGFESSCQRVLPRASKYRCGPLMFPNKATPKTGITFSATKSPS